MGRDASTCSSSRFRKDSNAVDDVDHECSFVERDADAGICGEQATC